VPNWANSNWFIMSFSILAIVLMLYAIRRNRRK
jgi:hypothetical protein